MPGLFETTIAELRQVVGSYLITSTVSPERSPRECVFGGTLRFYKEEIDILRRAYWRFLGTYTELSAWPDDSRAILQLLLLDRLNKEAEASRKAGA